ncbi:hypothetical protein [Nocardia goodfellowii]|uniref:Uncharacterized protein n=1 Tax=Nocardia goodfellowii TaxID=882446 RepID=A0ABS4QKL5_9NOCA|nr:hypothetical protein [Nocardia goodfellowii]MBP2191201.1 hypothetical protein [Nocardia goodfellowii]
MSINALASSGWAVFWVQLPLLVSALVVIVVATTALWRARPEDVPRIFEAFATPSVAGLVPLLAADEPSH